MGSGEGFGPPRRWWVWRAVRARWVRLGRVMGRRLWAFGFVVMVLVGDLLFVAPMEYSHYSVARFVLERVGLGPARPTGSFRPVYVVRDGDGLAMSLVLDNTLKDPWADVVAVIVWNRSATTAGLVARAGECRTTLVAVRGPDYRAITVEEQEKYRRFAVDAIDRANAEQGLGLESMAEGIRGGSSREWKLLPLGVLHDVCFVVGVVLVAVGAYQRWLTPCIRRRKARDKMRCAGCGYSLAGLVAREEGAGVRCPECGRVG